MRGVFADDMIDLHEMRLRQLRSLQQLRQPRKQAMEATVEAATAVAAFVVAPITKPAITDFHPPSNPQEVAEDRVLSSTTGL